MKNIFLAAWLAMNGFTFCLYGVDKRRAKRGAWRIPEKTLLLCTWLLGGVGALIGMRVFRHKTKHRAFTVSAPTPPKSHVQVSSVFSEIRHAPRRALRLSAP